MWFQHKSRIKRRIRSVFTIQRIFRCCLKDMIPDSSIENRSSFDKLDPRVKIVSAVCLSIGIALMNTIESLITSLVISVLVLVMARFNIRLVFKRLKVLFRFLIMLWIILPLAIQGVTYGKGFILDFNAEGLLLALKITLKSVSILFVFIALVGSVKPAIFGHALLKLKISPKLIFLFLITYRYIFVFEREYKKLKRAAKIRGFVPRTNLHTYRTYAYLFAMLFVRAFNRGEKVHQAMICRGFEGNFYSLHDFDIKRPDVIFAVEFVVMLLFIVFVEYSTL